MLHNLLIWFPDGDRDAKSGRYGRYICAILSKAMLIFGSCTDRNRNHEHCAVRSVLLILLTHVKYHCYIVIIYWLIFILQNVYLFNNASYLPKVSMLLVVYIEDMCEIYQWVIYMGSTASPVKISFFRKANLVPFFEGPTLHLFYSTWLLHLET